MESYIERYSVIAFDDNSDNFVDNINSSQIIQLCSQRVIFFIGRFRYIFVLYRLIWYKGVGCMRVICAKINDCDWQRE